MTKPTKPTKKPETFELADVKKRADENGCYMQMFVAYNPDTEVFVFASNDPCAKPGAASSEAALLAALVVEHLSSLIAGEPMPEPDDAKSSDETDPPKLH